MIETFKILNEMVSEGAIGDYALCGAMAAFRYIEPAATRDMDVTVDLPGVTAAILNFDRIVDFLNMHGLPVQWDEEGLDIAGVPVQFIPAGEALDRDALFHAEPVTEAGVTFKVWRIEHLMAKCVEVARPKDQLRLVEFLERNYDRDKFCELIARFELRDAWSRFCGKFDCEDFCGAA